MAGDTAATSILDFLTHPNPVVNHAEAKNSPNTRSNFYHKPKEVKKWDEFADISILDASFRGRLLQEARRGDRGLLRYPRIHPQVDCEIRSEKATEKLLLKWNQDIVNTAVTLIQHEYHSSIWADGGSPPKAREPESPPESSPESLPESQTRRTKLSRAVKIAKGRTKRSTRQIWPDSGSVVMYFPPPATVSTTTDSTTNSNSNSTTVSTAGSTPTSINTSAGKERFPKEYKPAFKWKSQMLMEGGYFKESGEWRKGKSTKNYAWPVRQAFTYCVEHLCRYGCILTCHEAFIFRVKPRGGEPVHDSRNPEVLRAQLSADGMMEYISIPWSNHCPPDDTDGPEHWTVNLALWFVHVLAGNNFEVDWRYDPLRDEDVITSSPSETSNDLAPNDPKDSGNEVPKLEEAIEQGDEDDNEENESSDDESVESDDTEPAGPTPRTPKRKRELDVEDGYNLSFSKRLFRS